MCRVLFLALVVIATNGPTLFASAKEYNCFDDFIADPVSQFVLDLIAGEFKCCKENMPVTIPNNFTVMSNLQYFTIEGCNFADAHPFDTLFMLTQLVHLSLRSGNAASVHISVPTIGWESLTDLRFLDTGYSHTNSKIPNFEALNGTLKYLYIQDLRVDFDFFPSRLGELTMLENLELPYMQIREGQAIGKLTNLKGLYIRDHKGSLPDTLNNLKKLTDLRVFGDGNREKQGTLPSLYGLSNLQRVHFNSYNVGGSIPESWGELTSLTSILISGASLTGSLPPTLMNLSNLIELRLNLYYPGTNGALPKQIGKLSKLNYLTLRGEQLDGLIAGFTGSIPESIGLLTEILFLDLSQNYFTGSVPGSITNLRNLKGLGIANTYLTGTLPAGMAELNNLMHVHAFGNTVEIWKPLPAFGENVDIGFDFVRWRSPGERCNRVQDGICCKHVLNYEYEFPDCFDAGDNATCLESGFCEELLASAQNTSSTYLIVAAVVLCVFFAGALYMRQRQNIVEVHERISASNYWEVSPVGLYAEDVDTDEEEIPVAIPVAPANDSTSI